MSDKHKQIFQADTPGRWNRFKWLSRALLLLLVIGAVASVITITSKQYPELPNLNPEPEKLTQKSTIYKDFKIKKAEIKALERTRRIRLQQQKKSKRERFNIGFYRAWEPQAYTSLQDHLGKLDMLVSDGFSVTPKQDTVTFKIDTGLMKLNKRYKKPVILSLTNYIVKNNVDGYFAKADVERIVSTKASRTTFINSVLAKLTQYKFAGLHLDIYEVNRDSKNYKAFEQEVYDALHAKGFLVTQNILIDDEDEDLQRLQKINDYLFLFAIDQHNDSSNDGDVSHQHWVEEILDEVCAKIPSEKVILTIQGGGYDWPVNRVGKFVGYQQAVSTAKENNKKIVFDPESANLHYSYKGTDSLLHSVYFTDAATNFNLIRMADDWGTAGVALWRLGTEDPRIWTFFQRNLSIASLRKNGFNLHELTRIGLNNKIDYTGDGEVLDLVTVPQTGHIDVKLDTSNYTIINQEYLKLPTKYVIRRYGYKPKKIVLTFDDGPDPDYTPRIIDILEKEKVPAAFFVVGSMVEKNIPLLKRIYNNGYEIGNHTYLHPDISQISLQRVSLELNATRKLIESVTGRSTILFRAPFNADAEPQTIAEVEPVAQSRTENYINIGESIDPHDWEPGVTADSIVARTIAQADNGSMVLLHDAGGDTREETVKALPRIIHYFKTHGYEFTTIADILGKSKDELMPVIKENSRTRITDKVYDFFVIGMFWGNRFLVYVFLTAIFLAIGRIVLIAILALRQNSENERAKQSKAPGTLHPVSIIVPAYNEEVTAAKTIQSLLHTNYHTFEILFVDDGSKDSTFEVVTNAYGSHPLVRVLTKPNGGKASALNFGIMHAKYEHVVCIDADTQLQNDAVYHLMKHFTDDEIGAVAGTVKVGNETNLITRWQSIEYITSQNMDRRAFDLLNSITVVPGAVGAFSKAAIFRAGGFTYDTLAEDCDLTMRILKQGYIIKNSDDAVAYTEAPETVSMLLKQRFRWSFGVIQSFWKNRDALFNKRFNFFGMVGMPNILIFQIILPLFSPIADLVMLFGLFSDKPGKILLYYLAFILVDFVVSIIAFWMEKEDYKKLIYIIPQRFIWRQLMYYVLFKSIRRALKGELSGWGVLKRTGNVTLNQTATEKAVNN